MCIVIFETDVIKYVMFFKLTSTQWKYIRKTDDKKWWGYIMSIGYIENVTFLLKTCDFISCNSEL